MSKTEVKPGPCPNCLLLMADHNELINAYERLARQKLGETGLMRVQELIAQNMRLRRRVYELEQQALELWNERDKDTI